ncbi:MAG: hypothetical protein Kow00120_04290 [Anaerolineae bacterium]
MHPRQVGQRLDHGPVEPHAGGVRLEDDDFSLAWLIHAAKHTTSRHAWGGGGLRGNGAPIGAPTSRAGSIQSWGCAGGPRVFSQFYLTPRPPLHFMERGSIRML